MRVPAPCIVIALGTLGFVAVQASAVNAQAVDSAKLARQAFSIMEKHCYRCHGQNGSKEGGVDYILDPVKLLEKRKIVKNDAAKSRLLRRITDGEMPPDFETPPPPRLTQEDVAALKKWIDAGAPAVPALANVRPFIATKDSLTAIRDHLQKTDRADRQFQRYFTFTHLHNLKKVQDQDLVLYRAALSKLINSLSWEFEVVLPRAIDPAQSIFAIDLRHLGWHRDNLWQEILVHYPYGLKYDIYPDDPSGALQETARQIYELSGTELPMLRADWFIATASRPPLYHRLLQIPSTAQELEKKLMVDVIANFDSNQVARAGFSKSGISAQNRMVERHKAVHGAYWKSYDFLSNQRKGNLFRFPLGPDFPDHPFAEHAFVHDGGEIIFNLPNGLQGYMLVNGKDNRIDEGPVRVVKDRLNTSGGPEIVNGLSCMACHVHGMIRFEDSVRESTPLGGAALDKLRRLYPVPAVMNQLLNQDERRFLKALDDATGPFLRKDGADKTDIKEFPETIGPIARWYRLQDLASEEIAAELGISDPKSFENAIRNNPQLPRLTLGSLPNGGTINREAWETLEAFTSPYQEASRLLKLGTPKRFHDQ